ncbi:MAG: M20/M25/M40 family metallo-hydrolase [Calditrichaeota bacterium]|nr:M20/M25/M40 family metallo-hydrolase [Calditrichota bacterium]
MHRMISVLLFLLFIACQQIDPQIDSQDVNRIISTLASDDMRGRATFTPDIERASEFIAGEFEKIGLEKLDGLNSYEQDFAVYLLKPESHSAKINGRSLNENDYFFSVKTAEINWQSTDDLEIITIGETDNIRSAFSQMRKSAKNAIVFVDPAQKETFERYKSFMSRAARTTEMKDSENALIILSKPINIKSIDAQHKSTVENQHLNNVAGKITGNRPDEIVLFSAHYDHIGIRRAVNGDSIYNGANDDASGTTAVISLAKYFKSMGKPERTLMFVTFTAEEMGGYGSQYFSQQLDPDKIVAMFNIEMIGKPASDGPNSCWITGFDRSSLGTILQKAVEGTEYKFYADPYPDQNLFYRSDNATLARLGVPAHSFSTTPIDVDKDYHQASDEVSTLNMDHMANTIKAIAKGAATIISGEATPSRVDKAKVD